MAFKCTSVSCGPNGGLKNWIREKSGRASSRLPVGSTGKKLWTLLAALAFLLVPGPRCLAGDAAAPPAVVGAWVVYWDCAHGLSELDRWGDLFDRASFFAYELDVQGNPVDAPGMEDWRPAFLRIAKAHGIAPWVTVVNDVRTGPGQARLKDVDAVRSLLEDGDKRAEHASRLAQKVKDDGFSGLDLDYEGLDASDQENMNAFVGVLEAECAKRGLKLNVVLEPCRGPRPVLGDASFTVMAYNLNGPHSKAGPRSTPDFITSLAGRLRGGTRAERSVALATGGFAWSPDGKVQGMDWKTAAKLKAEAVQFSRDHASGVPSMRLGDGTVIWFDDAESMAEKWNAASAAGFRALMVWRLGGNDDTLFSWLSECRSRERR